jgi:hypothetical protein
MNVITFSALFLVFNSLSGALTIVNGDVRLSEFIFIIANYNPILKKVSIGSVRLAYTKMQKYCL